MIYKKYQNVKIILNAYNDTNKKVMEKYIIFTFHLEVWVRIPSNIIF